MTTPRDPDERFAESLRDALHAEADSIDPRGDGLMKIRDRASSRSTTMRWFRPVAAVAAVVIVVGGIAGGVALVRNSGDDNSSQIAVPPQTTTPTQTTEPTPHPDGTPAGEVAAAIYYLHDDGTSIRLYREFHRVRTLADVSALPALNEMFDGSPEDPDYTSLWPEGTAVAGFEATAKDHLATVNLNAHALDPFNGGSEAAEMTVQQLVWTVTAADYPVRVDRVQILVDGNKVNDLFGTVDASKPIARHAPSYEVLGAVWILTPTEDQSVSGPAVKLSGVATVFEATVSIDILDGSGNVVKSTFATASQGAPGRGTWSKTVQLAPGDYVVKAYESSAEDGHPTHIDTKSFTVT